MKVLCDCLVHFSLFMVIFDQAELSDDHKYVSKTCQWKHQLLQINTDGSIRDIGRVDVRNTEVQISKNSKLLTHNAYTHFAINGTLMAYKTMLRLSIYCNGVYSPEVNLRVAQEDFKLYVHVVTSHITREGNHTGVVQNTFQGALTDLSVLQNSEQTCGTFLCEPAWVSPLPVYDNDVYLEISVEESPGTLLTAPLREFLMLNPFCGSTCIFGKRINISDEIADRLSQMGTQRIVSTLTFSAMDILTLGSENILFSDNQWNTVNAIKVEFKGFDGQNDVCADDPSPPNSIHVTAAATTGAKLFLATNVGLIEFSLNKIGGLSQYLVSRNCITRLKATMEAHNHRQRLLAFGQSSGTPVVHLIYSLLYRSHVAVRTEDFCTRPCSVIDVDLDGPESKYLIVLTKSEFGSSDKLLYTIWKYNAGGEGVVEKITEFENEIVKVVGSRRHTLLTPDIRQRVNKTTGKPDTDYFCGGCHKKSRIVLDYITSHSYTSKNLLLLGSHIIYGILGGRFYCLSDPAKPSNYSLVAADQSGLMVFFSKHPKQLLAWRIHTQVLKQIYPSHGWKMLNRQPSYPNLNLNFMDIYEVISIKFLIKGELLILFVNKDANQPNAALLKMEVDVVAVMALSEVDDNAFPDGVIVEEELEEHRCSYELTVNSTELLKYVRTQYYEWHMFPVARSSGKYRHSLSNILTNQLLVYNFLHKNHKSDESDQILRESMAYGISVSAIAAKNNLTQYSFGIKHSASLDRHNHRVANEEQTLPSVIYVDKCTEINFTVWISIAHSSDNIGVLLEFSRRMKIQLSMELSLPSLIRLTSTRLPDYYQNRVGYQVLLEIGDNDDISQELPGFHLIPVTFSMRSSIDDLHCSKAKHYSGGHNTNNVHNMQIMLGCPPQQTLFYDTQRSIAELEKLYDHLNCLGRTEHENCFYFQHPFYAYFKIYDAATGKNQPFKGRYTLKAIGGGSRYSTIRRFTPEFIHKYNSFNQSKKQLDHLMITPERYFPKETFEGFPVYDYNNGAIRWLCAIRSDCATPPLVDGAIPEYYFLLEFSNRGVDDTTNCLFELQFVVRAFGYKIGQEDYVVLLGTVMILTAYVLSYYFWKTKYYWLAALHHNDNKAIKKLLSLGNLAAVASQASLKQQLLEAIYNDDALLLSDALSKAETNRWRQRDSRQTQSDINVVSTARERLRDTLKLKLEKQIAEHDIRGMGITVGEMAQFNMFSENSDQGIMIKAKKILAKKANVVLHLIDAMDGQKHKELAEALTLYKEMLPFETTENNSLVRQATGQLATLLTKQLIKSLKKRDTWEIHYAIKEFRKHKIADKYNLLTKAEQVIYYRLTGKLKKAIKQGTPQLLRDAINDTERDLEFHNIQDREDVLVEAKNLLYKILKDKLADELKKRDSMKIRNAINRFAFYGVADASGFLEKANKNLYSLVIPPIARNLELAKTPEEIHHVATNLRSELNKYGLQDRDNVGLKAEKMLYDAIAKQLQSAIKSKLNPRDLAVILTAFIMSKKQYRISNDLRKLEEAGKAYLYQQIVPFLVKILHKPNVEDRVLASAIMAAKIEFSRIGVEDPGNIIQSAEKKLYDITFGSLRDMMEFSRDSKVLWMKMKSAQHAIREYKVVDSDDLLSKADIKFAQLTIAEIEDVAQRKDMNALKNMREFFMLISHSRKIEFLQLIERHITNLNSKLQDMNVHLVENPADYKNLCKELRRATVELKAKGNLQNIMPIITKFEISSFPDNDGAQKAALIAVVNHIDYLFKQHFADENYAKIALLMDTVNSAVMESKLKDQYYLATVVCGKYLTIKTDIDMAIIDKSLDVVSHIENLEHTLHSLQSLKVLLPSAYTQPLLVFEGHMRQLMKRAEEMSAFLNSVREIRNDLYEMNPVDVVNFNRYAIVPPRIFNILRAFLILLGRSRLDTERWINVRGEILNFNLVSNLLKEAMAYQLSSVDILQILEARDLCDSFLELIHVTEESTVEQSTLAIILKWVLLMINESTTYHRESGVSLESAIADYKMRRKARKLVGPLTDIKKDTTIHGRKINPTELAIAKALLAACRDVIRSDWTAAYLVRWIKAYPIASTATLYLNNSVRMKNTLKIWRLYNRYAPHDPLSKYGSVFEWSGVDTLGNPVFLCQFSKIDFDGLAKSCTPSQFMLHMTYLLEMVEHKTKSSGYCSVLVVDCINFQHVMHSATMETIGWFHAFILLMSRHYPGLFKTIYVVQGSQYKKLTEKFYINLFDNQPGLTTQCLEGESWRDVLHPLIDRQYLPLTMGGTYNVSGHLYSPGKIPSSYYLKESDRNSRGHWTSLVVDYTHPRILIHQQPRKTPGALIFCELEPDGFIDFEIYHLPPNETSLLKKTVLVFLSHIDHFYSNHLDASKPGSYHMAFTNTSVLNKRTVRYEAGLANTVDEIREFIYKLEIDEDGKILHTTNSEVSFFVY